MKDNKPIIKKLTDYIEKTEYWKYEDGLVLGSDEAQTILSALKENERLREAFEKFELQLKYLNENEMNLLTSRNSETL